MALHLISADELETKAVADLDVGDVFLIRERPWQVKRFEPGLARTTVRVVACSLRSGGVKCRDYFWESRVQVLKRA